MTQPLLFTVILNTNRREDTLACLASLAASTVANHEIIVLDNASTDGSVEAIQARFPAVQVIPLADNKGYAGNNNVGIEAALAQGADWVFVLNEDTIVDPDCLADLLVVGERETGAGILGPMVYHYDQPEVIQSAGGGMDGAMAAWHIAENEPDAGRFTEPHEVEWIHGCAILVRRAVIEQLGMLDERFFYYWEETEWCLRARRGGWRILHVPAAKLWHKGVQLDYQPSPNVTYYSTRNRLLMMSKHNASLAARGRAWWQIVRTAVSWSVKPRWRDKRGHRDAMVQGARDYLRGRWGKRVEE